MSLSESDFQTRVLTKLDKLEKRLFHDNGETCVQSKVNKNSLYIKWMAGIFTLVGGAFLSLFIFLLQQQLG